MLQSFVLLFCLVAGTGAQTLCSLPNEWTVGMTHVPAVANGGTVTSTFYYDYNTMRQANQYKTFTGTNLHRVVSDFNTMTLYHIDVGNVCNEYPISSQPMLPPTFTTMAGVTYMGANYIGEPSNSLAYEGWKIPLGGLTLTLVVSVPECVPILQGVVGTYAGGPVDDVLFFNGYTAGPVDQTKFDISMCPSQG